MIRHRLRSYEVLGFACCSMHVMAATAQASSSASPKKAVDRGSPSSRASSGFQPAPFELGLFGGVFLPSKSHELLSRGPFGEYDSPAPELGARAAVYPISFLGFELEGAGMPTKTLAGDPAGIWAARVHGVAQAPLGLLAPFAVIGAGALGAGSNTLGNDVDPAFHFGLGAKIGLDDFLSIRVDLRDTLAQKRNAEPGAQTHFLEAQLGLSFDLRPGAAPKPLEAESPKDRDHDGLLDRIDVCPETAGTLPDGCPIQDTDGDRVFDDKDACPKHPGRAPCGCPPEDADDDKVIDEFDLCPLEPGAIAGCPDPDADRDDVPVPTDRCPDKPETKNDFEDADGCPDEVPESLRRFSGVIQGIDFDRARDTLRPLSTPTLEAAVQVLAEYPSLRVLISGHTDTDGSRETNLSLSRRRAEAVKAYFVGKGVDAGRIDTLGEGPDRPIAGNNTAAGKQRNRRIEFKLLGEAKLPEKGQRDAPKP